MSAMLMLSFPYLWQGQPQMAYDRIARAAVLLFSNETLTTSPGGEQSLNTVAQIMSTDQGVTWSDAVRVDGRSSGYPTG